LFKKSRFELGLEEIIQPEILVELVIEIVETEGVFDSTVLEI
jgi:hypothetical protein